MDNSFLASIQKLEAMAFFSGYALVYIVMLFFWGNEQGKGKFTSRIISLLPVSYAFIGILFLGFQLKRLYPDYSWEHVRLTIQQPYLIGWGILSIAFLIPALKRQPIISLLHSCTFFYFIAADLFGLLIAKSADNDMVKNDMKVLAASVILNIGVLALIILLFTLDILYKKYKLRRI